MRRLLGYVTISLIAALSLAHNGTAAPRGTIAFMWRGEGHSSEVWTMGADGKNHRFVVEGSSPTWSPGGGRIAHVASDGPIDGNGRRRD
jgi:hypothetical protein